MLVQSVLFARDKWDIPSAISWLVRNGYLAKKVHVTSGSLRFRQLEPIFSRYYSRKVGNGVTLIVAY